MNIINISSINNGCPVLANKVSVKLGDTKIDGIESIRIHEIAKDDIVKATITCFVSIGNSKQ